MIINSLQISVLFLFCLVETIFYIFFNSISYECNRFFQMRHHRVYDSWNHYWSGRMQSDVFLFCPTTPHSFQRRNQQKFQSVWNMKSTNWCAKTDDERDEKISKWRTVFRTKKEWVREKRDLYYSLLCSYLHQA